MRSLATLIDENGRHIRGSEIEVDLIPDPHDPGWFAVPAVTFSGCKLNGIVTGLRLSVPGQGLYTFMLNDADASPFNIPTSRSLSWPTNSQS